MSAVPEVTINVQAEVRSDPLSLRDLVGGPVKVVSATPSASALEGILLATDPVTKTVVLVTNSSTEEGESDVKLLPHVSSVEKVESCGSQEGLLVVASRLLAQIKLTQAPISQNSEDLLEKKALVKQFLEANQLPVEEQGEELVILDSLRLRPPYTPNDCQANNEIILSRVVELISSM